MNQLIHNVNWHLLQSADENLEQIEAALKGATSEQKSRWLTEMLENGNDSDLQDIILKSQKIKERSGKIFRLLEKQRG